jgi:hypothetical protein
MRVLGQIIQISALSVLHVGKQFTLSDTIAPQSVGYDHSRHILRTLQKPLEEPLGGTRAFMTAAGSFHATRTTGTVSVCEVA